MPKEMRVMDAKWELEMKDGWCTLKLEGKLRVSTDNLEDVLKFIRKWHEPVSFG